MKRKPFHILLLCLVVLVAISCNSIENKSLNKKVDKKDNISVKLNDKDDSDHEKDILLKKIEGMTLKEKIGQLLVVGFEGTSINSDIENYIENYKVGGFILFSRNIRNADESFKLINDIKEKNTQNSIPLFISIDEEGGGVSRLPKEFLKLPSAKMIGNANREEISFEYGKVIGVRVKSLGFNLDFAPVLDINSNPKNPVIGDRSFGDTEKIVSKNGISVVKGLKEEGLISAVKHFPGHGDTSVDSHKNLPVVYKTKDELKDLELIPFKKAIKEDIDAIMVAHILYKDIDKDYPATMSKSIIEKLLREDLSFKGVVMSDDMTMGAIIKTYSLEEASVKFLKSGGDILLICHGRDNPRLVFEAIEKAVEEKILSEEEIDKKVYRIISLKKKYKINDKSLMKYDIEKINKLTDDFLKKVNSL
ncbi:beta-N-acetylhexosaminidase [Tissierella creatinophila]|uniref:Beta-hexosaminidase n=1 Tax=Tissierella creatinophila DSM 6911 TaxID=1123403 RepID=A0A1U7M6J5_TISCR|nr:beta-N-acetylhexosaminidase [Tissierella creatinophila]OLS02818.1 beta-hexosaminidase precursor [Tissierella creatinophila DSM 6911]